MVARLKYEDVKNFIEQNKHFLISSEYINNNTKLDIKCDKGHIYHVSFSKFQEGQRCPECTKKTRSYYRQFFYDDVKKDIESVGYTLLSDNYINTTTKIRIRCDKGHEYETTYKIWRKGGRCRKCSREKVSESQRLSYDSVRHLIEENNYKLLSEFYQNASSYIDVECDRGHKYQTTYDRFKSGCRCPYCFAERRGSTRRLDYSFIKQEIENVGYKLLSSEYKNANSYIKIMCDEGHIYGVTYSSFQQGHRCPLCATLKKGNSQRLQYDDIQQYIKKYGYKLLSDDYKNNHTKIKIQCPIGHIYNTAYNNFQRGHRCPICAEKQRKESRMLSVDEVRNNIENFGYKLISQYNGANHHIQIQCNNGHIYSTTYGNFYQGHRCPQCFGRTSNMERELQNWLSKYIIIERNKRFYYDQHKFYEADIYVPSKQIAIEFDGLYHHSELSGTPKNYHRDKTDFFKEQGIQLIHVFENEWFLKQDIVKSILLNKLGLSTNKLYARRCEICHLDFKEASDFLNKHHLQGNGQSSIRLGLRSKNTNDLMAIITFSKPRFDKKYKWEMVRFCSKINTVVIGGFSKLFNYFIQNYSGDIVSYADRRYSDGYIYDNYGFQLGHISQPNYFYFLKNSYILESRNKYQKHKLSKMLQEFDPQLSEWENMKINGYNRIFDCGNLVYVYER